MFGKGVRSMADTLYTEFCDPTEAFLAEPRAFCYDIATKLLIEAKQKAEDWYEQEKTIKGILLLLFTWNFAARETKKLNFENVGNLIRDNKEDLRYLEEFSVENIRGEAWDAVKRVFGNFKKLLGQTGASKALSLLNPHLFVMWDTAIRKRIRKELIRGIDNGQHSECYVIFLKGIQKIIKEYKIAEKLSSGAIIAKKIDEYHYVRIVMPKKTC